MFELKIDDARYWKTCVDSIVSLIDEGSFSITKEGISLKAMDPSGISMVSFMMPNKAFSKYDIDKPATVGLNLDNLSKILASSRNSEQLVMKESGNKFSIEFIGPNSRRRYKLPIIDVKKDADKEPKVEFDALVEVKSDSLKEILKDATLLSTYVGFKTEKDSFMVVAKGDAGELEEEHMNNADVIKKIEVSKGSSATFNLDYLDRMISAAPANSSINLSIKTEEPIRVEYKIGEAVVIYYLAPYMES
ncbi:MAG TPA: proliferating cell nuclear antigen (pcna) [Candidatus Baltobacteraceae bacterium]|nr:proliferating cell nuclear antigen (pcna) [Candidatus Baltobacteraceae bacterium]